jgi:hypothetical protein
MSGTRKKAKGAGKKISLVPSDVAAIRERIRKFLDTETEGGRKIGSTKFGVYAFFDYDGEPIYVGQTYESLRSRIGRHLNNQRTDAVAMNVLDPFEVADIEVWPLPQLEGRTKKDPEAKALLNATEYTVFQQVLKESSFDAVLNEGEIQATEIIDLPPAYRQRIIPEDLYAQRKHPDIRIARRAATIANLARVISERDVSKGLRKTLVTQAQRLEKLARGRFDSVGGKIPIGEPEEE